MLVVLRPNLSCLLLAVALWAAPVCARSQLDVCISRVWTLLSSPPLALGLFDDRLLGSTFSGIRELVAVFPRGALPKIYPVDTLRLPPPPGGLAAYFVESSLGKDRNSKLHVCLHGDIIRFRPWRLAAAMDAHVSCCPQMHISRWQ